MGPLRDFQDKEKAKLAEERQKVVERTNAIIAQAERTRKGPVSGARSVSSPIAALMLPVAACMHVPSLASKSAVALVSCGIMDITLG